VAQHARIKQPPDVPSTSPEQGDITYEEFLANADEDRPAEWVQGKVIFMAPVSRSHN